MVSGNVPDVDGQKGDEKERGRALYIHINHLAL
jgi:hypothetical protein